MECSRLHYSLFPHYLDTKIRQEHAAVATGKDPAPACLFNQTLLAFAMESRPNAHGSTCPGSEGRGHRRGRWRPAALHWPPHPPHAGPDSTPGPPQVLPRQTTSPQEPTLERGSAGVRGAKTCPCFAPFAFSLSGLNSVQRGLCQFKAGWRRCGPSTLCKALPHFRVKTTCHQSCLATS